MVAPRAVGTSTGFTLLLVTIKELGNDFALVLDQFGRERKISSSVRGGGTVPHVNERWVMERLGGNWILTSLVGTSESYEAISVIAAGTTTLDAMAGSFQQITLMANTNINVSRPTIGQIVTLCFTQAAGVGAPFTPTFPAAFKFAGGAAPTWSTVTGRRDVITFAYDGTFWYECSRSIGVR